MRRIENTGFEFPGVLAFRHVNRTEINPFVRCKRACILDKYPLNRKIDRVDKQGDLGISFRLMVH